LGGTALKHEPSNQQRTRNSGVPLRVHPAIGTPKGETAMSTANAQHHTVITKILVSTAIALGLGVAGATPASADPNAVGTDPNPFGTIRCSCQETAPADSPALRDEINRGYREGLSVAVPGLPAPAQRSQPRP
jgi:hypothetical protein